MGLGWAAGGPRACHGGETRVVANGTAIVESRASGQTLGCCPQIRQNGNVFAWPANTVVCVGRIAQRSRK